MQVSPNNLLESAWSKLDHGDSARAAELASAALETELTSEQRGEAMLVQAHVAVLDDDISTASDRLASATPLLADDPEILTDAANVALALGAARTAGELADRAIALDDELADAIYTRALAAEALGDSALARRMFVQTAELDSGDPDPPWAITVDEFAEIAEATLQELPPVIVEHLENVPIIVEAAPTLELVQDGVDPRLLGLFSGVPLTEKSGIEGVPTLDAIHLFQRNLERSCASHQELVEEIRITVLHETAHFFGLEDEDLEPLGLG